MRINSVSIASLLGLQFSKINSLEATFTKPITVVMGSNGSGKAQPYSTSLVTPTGTISMKEAQVGNTLLGVDGRPMYVTGVYERGVLPVYKCVFEDGRQTLCADDHLWRIRDHETGTVDTKDTKWLYDEMRRIGELGAYRFGIPLFSPFLSVSLSTTRIPLFRNTMRHIHRIWDMMEISGTSGVCRISDFSVAEAVISTWRTLGAIARYDVEEQVVRVTHPILDRIYHHTTECTDTMWSNPLYDIEAMTLGIKDIVPMGEQPCKCIHVDHPSHLYLADDYIVTHNTTLLNELVPTPAVRSDYLKHGRKTLTLDHKGETYTLSTDFNNKTAPHAFLKGDENLNVSGVTGVQAELIEKHLGYNQTIQDLITMKTNICSMGPAERKTFFLNNNPIDLRFILEKHKRIVSKIKEYKANLSMLHSRKSEISHKVLSATVLKEMEKNREQLQEQNTLLMKVIYALDIRINQLKNDNTALFALEAERTAQGRALIPKSAIEAYGKKIQKEARKYGHIDRTTLLEDIQRLQYTEHSCLQTIKMVQEHALELKKEIDTYQDRLGKATQTQQKEIERQFNAVKEAISRVPHDPRFPVFSASEITAIEGFYSTNRGIALLQSLDERPQHCLTPKVFQTLSTHLRRKEQQLTYLKERIADTSERHEKCQKEYNEQTASFPSGCQFPSCSLRETVDRRRAHLSVSIQTYAADLRRMQTEQKRIHRACTILTKKCEEQSTFQRQYQAFESTYWEYSFLQKVCTASELFYYVSVCPRQLISRIEASVINTKNEMKRNELLEQKALLEKELEVLFRNKHTSEQFTNDLLKDRTVALEKALRTLAEEETKLKAAQSALVERKTLLSYQQEGELLTKQFQEGASIYLIKKMIETCKWVRDVFTEQQNDIQEKLRDLESTLKEQHALTARLNDEIIANIDSIEAVKWQYEIVEKCLSPGSGLPHQYTVSYLNTLIHNVNYFISRIMTYPLIVQPLDTQEAIDFIFRVQVEDIIVRDISRLSKGQQEVVTLTWNLAILLQKQSLDQYPIFLDEIGTALDTGHAQRMMAFLHELVQSGTVPQIFLVNHNQSLSSDDTDTETICLRTENVILPEVYNSHVTIR